LLSGILGIILLAISVKPDFTANITKPDHSSSRRFIELTNINIYSTRALFNKKTAGIFLCQKQTKRSKQDYFNRPNSLFFGDIRHILLNPLNTLITFKRL